MNTLYDALIVLHLLFMAALLGGFFVAATNQGAINQVMVWGARLQLVTGVLMMSLAHAANKADASNFDMLVGIKLVIALAVVALAEIANAAEKKGEPKKALVFAAGGLALVNFAIGTLAL